MVYIGIYGGLALALLGWFFGRQAASKNRGLDEVHTYVWSKARSTSWYFTTVAICLLIIIDLSGIKLSVVPVLSILLFVHLASWGIIGLVHTFNLNNETPFIKSPIIIHAIIGSFFFIFFTILSILTDNWKFLLGALPPILVNAIRIIVLARKNK